MLSSLLSWNRNLQILLWRGDTDMMLPTAVNFPCVVACTMQSHFHSIAYLHCCSNIVQVQHEGVVAINWIELIEGSFCVTCEWREGRGKRRKRRKRGGEGRKRGGETRKREEREGRGEGRGDKEEKEEKRERRMGEGRKVKYSTIQVPPSWYLFPLPSTYVPDWMSRFASSLCCSTGNKMSDVTPNTCNTTPNSYFQFARKGWIISQTAWPGNEASIQLYIPLSTICYSKMLWNKADWPHYGRHCTASLSGGLYRVNLAGYKRAIKTSISHRLKHTKGTPKWIAVWGGKIRNGEGPEMDYNIEIHLPLRIKLWVTSWLNWSNSITLGPWPTPPPILSQPLYTLWVVYMSVSSLVPRP